MNIIDLSGIWQLYMDEGKNSQLPTEYTDTISLPDSTSHAKKGKKNNDRHTGYLTDTYSFSGYAWFRRKFTVTEAMTENEPFLFLERTRMTSVYLDGKKIGDGSSLSTPHLFPLPQLTPGVHELVICVNNTDYPTGGGHLTSPDTQTNWNGITGKIEIRLRPKNRIDNVQLYPDVDTNSIAVTLTATGSGALTAYTEGFEEMNVTVHEGENQFVYSPAEKMPLWSEHTPNVLTFVTYFGGEEQKITFGMRKIEAKGLKLYVNGIEAFLRGKHDGLVFPLTGFAPTTVSEWKRVFEIAKAYGINHYRFHTCCPPDAAFIAADEAGIYMQPELPFWGTVPDEITAEQQYLIDEGFNILREFGNHPSFVMMSLGNELWGNKEIMDNILKDYHNADPRHLYTDGSNNFQFWPCVLEHSDFLSGVRLSSDRLYRGSYAMCDAPQGHIQTCTPNSIHNYDSIIKPVAAEASGGKGGKILIQYGTGVKEVEADGGEGLIPDVPVISHEVGQYETYPDYRELSHYTGSIKAENIAQYRERAEEHGLIGYAEKYFRASGALAVQCYKAEIETALRSENLSGFQLLDLQDFPGQGTALVGVLNSLMEPKDTVSAEEWCCFCNSTVAMAELEKFIFSENDDVSFMLTVFNTDPNFTGGVLSVTVSADKEIVFTADESFTADKRVSRLRKISLDLPKKDKPTVYTLGLKIKDTEIHNSYTFTVYPELDIKITSSGISYNGKQLPFVYSEAEAIAAAQKGEKTVYIPSAEGKLEGTYCTDFWCYPMFASISQSMGKPLPVGTLGCLIDNTNDLFKDFPTEYYSTPVWFNSIMHSHCENLSGSDIEPIVQMIDNPHRADKLGIIFEQNTSAGKIFVCTVRLYEIADKPEAKWLARGIMQMV